MENKDCFLYKWFLHNIQIFLTVSNGRLVSQNDDMLQLLDKSFKHYPTINMVLYDKCIKEVSVSLKTYVYLVHDLLQESLAAIIIIFFFFLHLYIYFFHIKTTCCNPHTKVAAFCKLLLLMENLGSNYLNFELLLKNLKQLML